MADSEEPPQPPAVAEAEADADVGGEGEAPDGATDDVPVPEGGGAAEEGGGGDDGEEKTLETHVKSMKRKPSVSKVEAHTLSSQANQVESETPIKDPVASVPDNLVLMSEMTQELLMGAVQERFEVDGIYTFVADILVALNPYQWIDMYGKAYKERYSPSNHVCTVPHVYSVAQSAAKNLRLLNRNQVCIISGESGAGKTETAKLFMHHLLEYSGGAGTSTALERQILESQPLLEAFGNAKTGLNNNSSRFGKYIEVLYEGMDVVLGARVRKYLLEKSRVIHQVEGERNFHVFYYLCDGAPADLKAKLKIEGSETYRYLQSGNGGTVDEPATWFNELARSLKTLGFEDDVVMSMWTSLAAILKTGQLDFKDMETSESCTYVDEAIARDLAETLEVDFEKLTNALTTRHVVTVGEIFHRPLTAEQARGNRDVLAQNMYDNLFSWITDCLNALLSPVDDDEGEDEDARAVAVLDIFGFENFEHNGFEQMFINTANEKLQHYFIQHIFTYEVNELKEEGIRAPKVEYTTNEGQVEILIGDRGIFGLLDEQTKVPNANDANTLVKFHQVLGSNPNYDDLRKSPIAFQINHYAGSVKYEIESYLEKNRNTPSLGIAGMIKSSANPVIAGLFKFVETTEDRLEKDQAMKKALKSGDPSFMRRQSQFKRFGKKPGKAPEKKEKKKYMAPWQIKNAQGKAKVAEAPAKKKIKRVGSGKRRAGLTTLSAAFKASLEDLMEMLNAATPHFVRCIKPNMTKSAKKFDYAMVEKQLNYTGVLETTKIRQNGYPLRLKFGDFCEMYRDTCIPATYKLTTPMYESSALRILQNADLHGWGKGKTKLFLKYEHVNVLINLIEGKKRAANEERAVAKAKQDIIDAEAAEIERKREIEVAKIRAAAEAQPTSKKVTSSLSWQEEMALAKEKKKQAAAEKKRREEEAAANAPKVVAAEPEAEDEEAAAKARFAKMKGMFGASKPSSSPAASPKPARGGGGGGGGGAPKKAAAVAAPPPSSGGDEGAAGTPCGTYRLDMAGKQFGDCKCGFSKKVCLGL